MCDIKRQCVLSTYNTMQSCNNLSCASFATVHIHCNFPGCDAIIKQIPECNLYDDYDHRCCDSDSDSFEFHMHCFVDGCENTQAHTHCFISDCQIPGLHYHCEEDECDLTTHHRHCVDCDWVGSSYDYHHHCESCGQTDQHRHCNHPGCDRVDHPQLNDVHYHCGVCNIVLDALRLHMQLHHHCNVKECEDYTTNDGTSHTHCPKCELRNPPADHYHCKYDCGDTVRHRHCGKCKQRKDRGHKC